MTDGVVPPPDIARLTDMLKELTLANMECAIACRTMLGRMAASVAGFSRAEFDEALELLNAAFDRSERIAAVLMDVPDER